MFTQPAFFRHLKDFCLTVDWLNYDLPERDAPIRPLLAVMNSHPGIATRWSCPSHPEDDPLRDEDRNLWDDEQLYVTCAVDESGFAALMRFYNAVSQWPDTGALQVSLKVTHLQMVNYDKVDPIHPVLRIMNIAAREEAEKLGLVEGRWTAFSFDYNFHYSEEYGPPGTVYNMAWRNAVIDRLIATWLEVNPV